MFLFFVPKILPLMKLWKYSNGSVLKLESNFSTKWTYTNKKYIFIYASTVRGKKFKLYAIVDSKKNIKQTFSFLRQESCLFCILKMIKRPIIFPFSFIERMKNSIPIYFLIYCNIFVNRKSTTYRWRIYILLISKVTSFYHNHFARKSMKRRNSIFE